MQLFSAYTVFQNESKSLCFYIQMTIFRTRKKGFGATIFHVVKVAAVSFRENTTGCHFFEDED